MPRTSQKPGHRADLASSGKKSRFGSRLISANKGNPKPRGNDSGKQPNQVFNMSNSSSDFQDRTPVGKSASGSGLDCADFDGNMIDESTHSSASFVKTPPIEPSVSPEIPYGLSQKPATASAATPCYGAGHVLSGVTDKRKCRPRGVLTVAPALDLSSRSGKSSESDNKSRTSFVPLPIEASMCWMSSSPSEKPGKGQFRGLMGSNPSITINPIKPHEIRVLGGCVCSELTPTRSKPSRVEKNDSPHSTSTLSCGNVIQTPNSDCELGFQYELDEATDILRSASLSSAQNQMPDSDDPGTSFKFSNCNSTTTFSFVGHITGCHKHGDTSVSCLSESSTGNAYESNIRVSWRDVSLSRTPAMDSCRWLPDDDEEEEEEEEEEDNMFCYDDHQIKPAQSFEDSDDLVMDKVLKLPEFLDQEPCIYNNGVEKVFPQRPSSCAESIFTDDCRGGGLVSSADSDWNL
ncbi:unnamed protein product [Cuscuta campestris]|uniref:Uncharacterized protein n=1 Tax=Cuscuta campestris TaxID=132261 RepID=A0A484M0Q8_9ASTE|nr:unnamed protein product [Cuscuta campestris]